jgi:thiamine-monophosphate kinase
MRLSARRPAIVPDDSSPRPATISVNRRFGEFQLIDRLVEHLGRPRRAILGPGDDCAVLPAARARQLFTIDSMVEGVHFRLSWGTPEMLGARALTVNLSDIAAMGGVPTACVVNLEMRDGLGVAFFDRLYKGLSIAARQSGTEVVGGNVTRSETFAITIALLGTVRGAPLRRDSARLGDTVYVTGTVGDAAAGLRILSGRIRAPASARNYLIGRFLRPQARLAAGRRLTNIRPTPSAIDLSDGLIQDLGHILERSGVGAEIDAAALPLSTAYRATLRGDPELALGGGEDYELLFCLRRSVTPAELTRRLGVRVTRIGRITSTRRATVVDSRSGMRFPAPQYGGWDQLRAPGTA